MEKQTKADMYRNAAKLLEVNAPEYAGMLLEDAQRIEARNASRRNVDTKVQKENKHIAALVIEFFHNDAEDGIAYDSGEIANAVGIEVSPQKMSAIMRLVGDEVDKVGQATNNKDHIGYKKKGTELVSDEK